MAAEECIKKVKGKSKGIAEGGEKIFALFFSLTKV
jgi:hypothetical protein